jgi:23S rRNA (guanosine2251-2'-O)-methyltransferase
MNRKLTHSEILSKRLSLEESKITERHPVSVILYNIRSLYNVGSLFRTCDSALVKELILTGYTPHPPRAEIEKTALGAVDTVPWRYDKSIFDSIEIEKSKGNKIIALEITNNKKIYDNLDINDFPMTLILGNELTGIDNDVIEKCDFAIEIPMFGVKHSLNVGVAGGIAIFESIKKYRVLKNLWY